MAMRRYFAATSTGVSGDAGGAFGDNLWCYAADLLLGLGRPGVASALVELGNGARPSPSACMTGPMTTWMVPGYPPALPRQNFRRRCARSAVLAGGVHRQAAPRENFADLPRWNARASGRSAPRRPA